jgi:hypothetical protein
VGSGSSSRPSRQEGPDGALLLSLPGVLEPLIVLEPRRREEGVALPRPSGLRQPGNTVLFGADTGGEVDVSMDVLWIILIIILVLALLGFFSRGYW